jgi:hypothetical protein
MTRTDIGKQEVQVYAKLYPQSDLTVETPDFPCCILNVERSKLFKEVFRWRVKDEVHYVFDESANTLRHYELGMQKIPSCL